MDGEHSCVRRGAPPFTGTDTPVLGTLQSPSCVPLPLGVPPVSSIIHNK